MRPDGETVPTGWKVGRVGELVERLHEKRGDLEPEPTVLSCSKDHGLIPQLELFKRRLAAIDSRRYKLVSPGEFVYDPNLLWSGAIARSRLGTKGIVSPVYEVFKVVGDCSEDFLYEWLISPNRLRSYRAISMGTNVRRRRADFSDFCRLPILLPSLSEQRTIAGVLDAIDEAIERTEAVIAATERLRDSLLHELLTRGVPGWEIKTLAEAPLEIIDGDRGKNYPKQRDFSEGGHCLFLNTANVTSDGFNFSSRAFISSDRDQRLGKGKLVRDDVVLTTRGTVGNSAHFDESVSYDHLRINSGMVILRPSKHDLYPGYLYAFVRSQVFLSQVNSFRTGSAQPQLPIRVMERIKIALPPFCEQRAIAGALGAIDAAIVAGASELDRRRAMKACAADALLTGRLRTLGRVEHSI